jgi:hypothetical protein
LEPFTVRLDSLDSEQSDDHDQAGGRSPRRSRDKRSTVAVIGERQQSIQFGGDYLAKAIRVGDDRARFPLRCRRPAEFALSARPANAGRALHVLV